MERRCVILGGARTAMTEWVGGKTGEGKPGGLFAGVSAIELGSIAAVGAMKKCGVAPKKIEHVVMGNALQTSADALYGARHVALKAGIPVEVPALTVNRLCGSGIQSVIEAAHLIQEGTEYVLAGGMENMSQAPHVIRGARSGLRFGQGELEDCLMAALKDSYCGLYMAETAEKLAKKLGITRQQQDEYALRSIQLGERSIKGGAFSEEIVAVEVRMGRGKKLAVEKDDHCFIDATIEGLSKLAPAFGKEGTVSAGNASGIVDGAACLVVSGEEAAKRDGFETLSEIISWHVTGVDPSFMGIGPVPAIKGVLHSSGLKREQIDLFEINEAFSAQYLAVEKELGLERDRVNVNGGAIAIGHPLGATGTRLILTLALEMRRSKKKYGIAAACIGGGQGIAMIIRNVTI